MLISCSSCNSKYLVNSADLKPDGRNVQCAKCGHLWFQSTILEENEILSTSVPSSKKEIKDNNIGQVTNLPSTYVKKQKPSIINSLLILALIIFLIVSFWTLKNNGINFFVLINFYIQEFYFNLIMIIEDITKIINYVLN